MPNPDSWLDDKTEEEILAWIESECDKLVRMAHETRKHAEMLIRRQPDIEAQVNARLNSLRNFIATTLAP